MSSFHLVSVSPTAAATKADRRDPPTAHAAIDALVERGDLVEITGRERRRIYEAPRFFEAVHGSIDVESH
ncbi:MAG: hypothetical protein DYH08_15745 [Actinobacteria bacterium ATB1]|nr:hypothetical protein [Actinobacteria bacterium ATB1]